MNKQDEIDKLAELNKQLDTQNRIHHSSGQIIYSLQKEIQTEKVKVLKETLKLHQYDWELIFSYHPGTAIHKTHKLEASDFDLTIPQGIKNNKVFASFVEANRLPHYTERQFALSDCIRPTSIHIGDEKTYIAIGEGGLNKKSRDILKYMRDVVKQYNLRVNINTILQQLQETTELVKKFKISESKC